MERFRRALKYEDVYLKGYETVAECRKGLGALTGREHTIGYIFWKGQL